jgi:DNA-binding LacI/PurR family transcriptional regulator
MVEAQSKGCASYLQSNHPESNLRGSGERMTKTRSIAQSSEAVTLRTVADRVGLAPCSVSAILNNSPASMSIPQHTKKRVLQAAARLNYRPNYSARSLRTKRSYTVAVLAPDLGRSPAARIIAGAEEFLSQHGYGLMIASYDRAPGWLENYFPQMRQRGVEGVIAVQAKPALPEDFPVSYVDPFCAYSPEPLPTALQQRLEEAGRHAAENLVRQIEQAKPATFGGINSATFSGSASIQPPASHFVD